MNGVIVILSKKVYNFKQNINTNKRHQMSTTSSQQDSKQPIEQPQAVTPPAQDVKQSKPDADVDVVKRVIIQSLPPVEDKKSSSDKPIKPQTRDNNNWINRIKSSHRNEQWQLSEDEQKELNAKVLNFTENVAVNRHRGSANAVFDAFLSAYNNHGGVTLVPDDLWCMIISQFSEIVAKDPEALREKFVNHQGKKKLTVSTPMGETDEKWDTFFLLMIEEIRKNTKPGVTDDLMSDFTTTKLPERLLSVIKCMDVTKHFFEFGRCIPCCGITHVDFKGTLQDWKLLIAKLRALVKYDDAKGSVAKYIEVVTPILQKFVDTYQGNVDVEWWTRVMNFSRGQVGSGSTTYVSGWIIDLITGRKGSVDVGDIKAVPMANVDVNVQDETKLVCYQAHVVGGLNGVHYDAQANSYRPASSFIVWYDQDQVESLVTTQPSSNSTLSSASSTSTSSSSSIATQIESQQM